MDIPLSFFLDEEKNGFYVSTQLKQLWGSELMLLAEIDKVCRKHNIKYFADWGSMLGAIRHGGYVPWDDDLDICMRRDAYNHFLKVAKDEFPEGYEIVDYRKDRDNFHSVIRVTDRFNMYGYDEENLKKHYNFPYAAIVDIFIMDYLYPDKKEEKKRCDEIIHLMAILNAVREDKLSPYSKRKYLEEIKEKYDVEIDSGLSIRDTAIEIYRIIDEQSARVQPSLAEQVGEIDPWILMGRDGYPKEYYDKDMRIPFEFMTIPVQYRYNEVMTKHYGNYFQVRKGAGLHVYPCYMGQEEKLKELLGMDELPKFQFDLSRLRRSSYESGGDKGGDSLKALARECLRQICEWQKEFMTDFSDIECVEYEKQLGVLADCQQLAVDLGTLSEQVKGENNPVTIALENYCEVLFRLYECVIEKQRSKENNWESQNEMSGQWDEVQNIKMWSDQLADAYDRVETTVKQNIIDRKVILFLPNYYGRWSGFQTLYEETVNKGEADVYVVPLPLYKKGPFGSLTQEMIYSPQEYPEDLPLLNFEDFNLSLCHPDIIYIQDVYDNEHPLFSIPVSYYTAVLRDNCEKLVYVPFFEIDEFEKGAMCETFNISILLATPGIMNADEIWAQSGELRECFIEMLSEYAGKTTREIWEEKIISRKLPIREWKERKLLREPGTNKNILYCIGANELSENSGIDKMLDKVKERFETFASASSSGLSVTVTFYPPDLSEWRRVNEKALDSLTHMIRKYEENTWCEVDNSSSMQELVFRCDAYYGEPSPMVLLFKDAQKPVMIAMPVE